MTKPAPRPELVDAVREARAIVIEAIPAGYPAGSIQETVTMRAAALPVILRELLDVEVTP